MGLEPWESSLSGWSKPVELGQGEARSIGPMDAPTEETPPTAPSQGTRENVPSRACSLAAPQDEKLCLVRLTDSLSRGVWPTYARLACALNLLSLRAIHAHLCGSIGDLLNRRNFRTRAPLSARVCGIVPFLSVREETKALGTLKNGASAQLESVPKGVERGGMLREFKPTRPSSGVSGSITVSGGSPSTAFYSAFLHPLYVWAQCLDRQFYSQARCTLAVIFLMFIFVILLFG